MKQAGIYVNDVFCGVLTEDEEGYHFCYRKEYRQKTTIFAHKSAIYILSDM